MEPRLATTGADDQDGQVFLGGTIIGHGCIGNGANPSWC